MNQDRKICVGAIAGAFGVRGEVRLKSFCANPEDIAKFTPLQSEGGEVFTIQSVRPIKNGFSARISEINSREEAEALRSTRLYALRDQFPELVDEEYYHSDLIGMEVQNGEGSAIGKVKSIHNFGAGDLIEIHYQGRTVLIPFTKTFVPTVDIQARTIVIDPPEGLIEG